MLRHCLPASIRQTLKQLPKSLDDTYLRVLRQIPEVNQAHAHRMLECLVVAVRPLRVEELAELLAFEFDAAPGGIPKYRPALRLDDQTQAVLSTCSSLVTIIDDEHSRRQIVQFSHFSVKEFLVSNRLAPSIGDISRYHIRLGPAHTTLTQACLGLLLHTDNQITEGIVEDSPLADYAAEHWVEHAQFEDVVSRVKDGMETLFDPDKPHFEAWVEICDIDPVVSWRDTLEQASPLYYSVLCGFYDLVEHLAIKHPQYINAFGGDYGFPLLAALGEGHGEVAELLLKHGADIAVREATGKTMLLVMLSSLHHDNPLNMIDFLLTHGADVNARDDTFKSSLHLAEESYCMRQVVTMLLKHGADVNSQDNNGKTPLHMLLESEISWRDDGHAEDEGEDGSNDVRLLLEHGADVNIRDEDNRTPLLLAMELGWFRTACILIEHGADANTENKNGRNLLHELVLSESSIDDEGEALDYALLLLKHGVEVNKRDEDKDTPLHLSIVFNWFGLAGILLEHGADANAENDRGMTPLHKLSESDIKDDGNILNLMLLLLKHGAEVNRRDRDNETPLHLAIRWDRFKLAEILLEHGADAIAENNEGQTPLHILSESDIYSRDDVLNLVLLLLRHGAKVNSGDENNQTPLHLAIRHNRFKLAEILLKHDADAYAKNDKSQTPLHIFSESNIKDDGDVMNLALLLLRHGAEVNSGDENNQTSLHLAIRHNRFKLAEILLEHGADANTENNQGMSPFHMLLESHSYDEGDLLDHALLLLKHGAEVNRRVGDNFIQTLFLSATERGRFELACILLDLGADANAINGSGKTPLHILSELEMYDKRDVASGDVLNHTRPWHGAEVNRPRNEDEYPLLLPRGMGMYKFACM